MNSSKQPDTLVFPRDLLEQFSQKADYDTLVAPNIDY